MKKVFLVLITGVILAMMSSPAFAVNLIVNPGAESGTLGGWTAVGPMYATMSQAQSTGTVLPHSGSYFFSAANAPSNTATLTQSVDVSSYASYIDNGLALYDAGFWYQTEYWDGGYDKAKGTIYFYDLNHSLLFSDSSEELGSTVWAYTGKIDYIPVNTRTISMELGGIRYYGTYTNAFFDDAKLEVNPIPEPATLSLLGLGLVGLLGLRKKI